MPTHKILIVEDQLDLAEALQSLLEHLGLAVLRETHGYRALAVVQAEHPDVLLLDLKLPDMTGWQVVDAIREQQHGEPAPAIIVLTAYGDVSNRLMGQLEAVYTYLVKPCPRAEIEQAVLEALRRRER